MTGRVARVAAAIAMLRRGEAVRIRAGQDVFAVRAVEMLEAAALAGGIRRKGWLVLTHARARTLKIPLYTPGIVALKLDGNATIASLRAIADPASDLDHPLKGPFAPLRQKLSPAFAAGAALAKLAGLLPAVIAEPAKGADVVSADDIAGYDAAMVAGLSIITRAAVPLEGAEDAEMVAFRAPDAGPEHYAIVIGAPRQDRPVLVRLHSECFTGDLLGSLKCDCGAQLRGAVAAIEKAGGGVLLYLAQEGRGIGLVNKLRAYRLQDQGFDTLDANERLGFARDERRFAIAARMLTLLGYDRVRLLTNNPQKIKALKQAGLKSVIRVAHQFPANAHNRAYLQTKAERGGHLLHPAKNAGRRGAKKR